MTLLRPIVLLSSVAALAGCANSQNFGSVTGPSQTFAQSAADTYHNRINDGGVSGKIALQDTSTGEVRVADVHLEVSSDYSTAFLTIGNQRYELTATAATPSETGGTYRNGPSDAAAFGTISPTTYEAPLLTSLGSAPEGGYGRIGRETPVGALPSAMASYSGSWFIVNLAGMALGNSGGLTMDVDFAAAADQVSAEFTDLSTTGIFGTLSADLLDNGFIGILLIDGSHDNFSGDLTVEGTFYGPAAEQVAGVISGDVTTTSDGTGNVIGTFEAN